jgi:excisionase family DNA binding protein
MQKATPLKPVLISKRDAAVLLAVSLRTVENLIARRSLPVCKIGKRVLIPFSALEAFAKNDHETGQRKEKPVMTGAGVGATA